jgi:5-(carboxyamino)imidazole ribonucleotide synthase
MDIQQDIILPPATIGIMGGGQLGMMLAIIARQFGYKVAILEPNLDCPAHQVADIHITTAYDDEHGLAQLAQISSIITTEFENVPATSLEYLAQFKPVYPSSQSIKIAQDRGLEKQFFQSIGLKTADFQLISNIDDCDKIEVDFFPAILKTTQLGYDGKGQQRVTNLMELKQAYLQLSGKCILEKMVNLAQEVSVIIARNQSGIISYPLIENQHRNGILDISYIPAHTSTTISQQAFVAAQKIIKGLNYIGLLTIEFFITHDGELLVNEIAPRPHNSGHITLDCALSSQFEQQLRAICGLPLASSELKTMGAMLNLLGEIWLNNSQVEPIIFNYSQAKLHLYGKTIAKYGRKMGHVNLMSNSRSELEQLVKQLKKQLNIE